MTSGATVFLQLGVIFAVLLAFVFSEAWTEYNEASAAIDLEVGALHGAAMIAATLPPAQAKDILTKTKAYLDSVVQDEWPVMATQRGEDLATDRKLQALIQACRQPQCRRFDRARKENGNSFSADPGARAARNADLSSRQRHSGGRFGRC